MQDYTFGPEKMNVDPHECKIMLTEPPMSPLKNRQKMIEVMHRFGAVDSRSRNLIKERKFFCETDAFEDRLSACLMLDHNHEFLKMFSSVLKTTN